MNFNDYKKGPAELPFLEEVASEYLIKPDGKPTLLTYLLKNLGCTIHPQSDAHGLTPVGHDERILSPTIHRVIADYTRYHDHHHETYDETIIGDAMRDHTSSLLDPYDFVPGTTDLQPISINGIQRFMLDTSLMRVGKSDHFKRNSTIQKLQYRISEVSKTLAIEITQTEVSKIARRRLDIMQKINEQVGEKAGFERFSDQMDALRSAISKSEMRKIDADTPIDNPNVLERFATLRALVRVCNREMGIDTENEQKRLREERASAEIKNNQPRWRWAA